MGVKKFGKNKDLQRRDFVRIKVVMRHASCDDQVAQIMSADEADLRDVEFLSQSLIDQK